MNIEDAKMWNLCILITENIPVLRLFSGLQL